MGINPTGKKENNTGDEEQECSLSGKQPAPGEEGGFFLWTDSIFLSGGAPLSEW